MLRPRAGVRGLGAAFKGGWGALALGSPSPGEMGDILQVDRYALRKCEVTVHRLLSGLVLKSRSSCTSYLSPLWSLIHPTLPHRFFTFFYGVSTPPSHRAAHCFGILRGVSPESSRNILPVKGGSGKVASPLRPDSTGVGFLHGPPTLACG